MKKYNLERIIKQCGDCKDNKFMHIKDGPERMEIKCLRTGIVLETEILTDENRWVRKDYKSYTNKDWFPDSCPLENVKEEKKLLFLVCLDGHGDDYKYHSIMAYDVKEMKKIVEEYCRLNYANFGERTYVYSSHAIIADPAIERIHHILDEEYMQELRDDASEDLLKEYDDRKAKYG
jgi:hypothetical protein